MSDPREVLHHQATGPVVRVILAVFSLVPLAGFWDLVVAPWPAALHILGLPMLFIGLTGLIMGTVLLAIAVTGPRRTVIVDWAGRMVIEQGQAALIGPFHRRLGFDEIAAVLVDRDPDSESIEPMRLILHRTGGRRPRILITGPEAQSAALAEMAGRLARACQVRLSIQPGSSATDDSTASA